VKEARRLGVPVFAIVDTNCDPEQVDYPIPANDDAIKSIQVITRTVADAVLMGKERSAARQMEMAAEAADSKGKDEVEEKATVN
jgi:small subunit ribosomal protein S2